MILSHHIMRDSNWGQINLESRVKGESYSFSSDLIPMKFYRYLFFASFPHLSWKLKREPREYLILHCFHYKTPLEKWVWQSTVGGTVLRCENGKQGSIVPKAILKWLIVPKEIACILFTLRLMFEMEKGCEVTQLFSLVSTVLFVLITQFIKALTGAPEQLCWQKPWMGCE